MIDWVFLDVGNVLLDEDFLTFSTFLRHVEAIRLVRPDLSFLDLLAEREERARSSRWPVFDVASAYLDEKRIGELWTENDRDVRSRYGDFNPPIPGAFALIEHLKSRFRLGLIANQPVEGRAWLGSLGWLDRFQVVVLSEAEGISKPDPRLFRLALDRAGAEPGRSVMVGDRLDNDVAPASSVGMKTAHLRWPRRSAKAWSPVDPEGLAYLRSLERSAAHSESTWAGPRPWASVDGLAGLAEAIERLSTPGDRASG